MKLGARRRGKQVARSWSAVVPAMACLAVSFSGSGQTCGASISVRLGRRGARRPDATMVVVPVLATVAVLLAPAPSGNDAQTPGGLPPGVSRCQVRASS